MNKRFLLICCLLACSAPSFAQNEKVLYSFGTRAGDGTIPFAGVTIDAQGRLFGVASQGGSNGVGAIYELTAKPQRETVLHSFGGDGDGAYPTGNLIFDASGNLYGTTENGGNPNCTGGCGTVFEFSPPSEPGGQWAETVIYAFSGGMDGNRPYAGVVFDGFGNLYGTTAFGGGTETCGGLTGEGCGTVFALSPPVLPGGVWTEAILYSFTGGGDGGEPNAPVVFDKDGNLYGTTVEGGFDKSNCGPTGCGAVFELSPSDGLTWKESVLHRFTSLNKDGDAPLGGLVFDGSGDLIGTTIYGGIRGNGTVFGLSPPVIEGGSWTYSVLYYFPSGEIHGANPQSGMIASGENANILYGTTSVGGIQGNGTVFRLMQSAGGVWEEKVLHSFGVKPDGITPIGGVVLHDHALYGTTIVGGVSAQGTAFMISQ